MKEIWNQLDRNGKILVVVMLAVGILQVALGVYLIWKNFAN